MNIPPKYEDVVAKLDAALGREAALREELARYKSLFGQAQKAIDRLNELHPKRMGELAKRLTVAEQRAAELKKLLCDVINEAPAGFAALKVDLANRVNDAFKPAAEGEGS